LIFAEIGGERRRKRRGTARERESRSPRSLPAPDIVSGGSGGVRGGVGLRQIGKGSGGGYRKREPAEYFKGILNGQWHARIKKKGSPLSLLLSLTCGANISLSSFFASPAYPPFGQV